MIPNSTPGPTARALSPLRLALVALVGLATIAAAFWLSLKRHLPRDPEFGTIALPGLADRLPDVARVRLSGAAGQVTLERRDGRFVVVERSGYRADRRAVDALLAALADLKVAAPPDPRHPVALGGATRIELDGPQARLALELGEATGPETVAARLPGATDIVEVGPVPDLTVAPAHWLSPVLVDLPAGDVRRIEWRDGGRVTAIARMPGEAVQAPGDATDRSVEAVVAALGGRLTVRDVRPASADRAAGTGAPTVSIALASGLLVELEARADATGDWIALTASSSAEPARARAAELTASTEGLEFKIDPACYRALYAANREGPR